MQALEEGQNFERYRILQPSGRGIAGINYIAEDTRQKRKVLLKLIHPWAQLSDAARRQFYREINAISHLSHPQIAPIFNYGEWHGQPFVTRIYAEYGSLLNEQGRVWFRPPFDASIAIGYAIQIGAALTQIHNIGYAHGALSFSNLLITQQPQNDPKAAPFLLSDCSLATFVRSMGQPQTTFFSSTTAPEQFEGQTIPASDQYALAILLYFWLTGRPPFLGLPEEIKNHKNQGTIPSLLPFNDTVSYELEHVIRRALSPNTRHRFIDVQAFAQALTNALNTTVPASVKLKSFTTEHKSEQQPTPTTEPMRRIEPDAPQPHPNPTPIPLPLPEPEPDIQPAPQQPDPLPKGPRPMEPDIAQPIPDATPITPPEIEPAKPVQPEKKPEGETLPDTEPRATMHDRQPSLDAYLIITPPVTLEPFTYPITQSKLDLGRAGSSDVVLDQDETISRHHASICKEEDNYVLYDCRSTYGVSVNGHKLVPEQGRHIKTGDQFCIGEYKLVFYYGNQPAAHYNTQKEHALS
ncbi:hypothetical protein KDA_00750 [Dictyobacter alpinus]|uniref:non-specific serine/threonine protein kinase n=1 Tax=Dictyobacter alpinus TaxID=2014873 RepID=A0A402AZR8_9CHLR|nr:FHA domain-containing serine/threonine-protein kinase [Dictyobacter alpinus]GCE24591.1 hypothetical protein KDA_00750 [Dictyobacter alpinus]